MIKEVYFKITHTHEHQYSSVHFIHEITQPFKLKTPIPLYVDYIKNQLNQLLCIYTKIQIKPILKDVDYCSISSWPSLVCVSQRFKNVFETYLNGYWYPTDQEGYYIFLLDRCLDALDKNKTLIINPTDQPHLYTSIQHATFKPETEQEFLFTILQEPLLILATSRFEQLYRQYHMTGVQFYKDINFKNPDRSEDIFRFKNYDDEGNCLNP